MLVRIRWFMLGVLVTAWGGAVIVGRLVRVRERLTAASMLAEARAMAASALERLASGIGGESRA